MRTCLDGENPSLVGLVVHAGATRSSNVVWSIAILSKGREMRATSCQRTDASELSKFSQVAQNLSSKHEIAR